MISKLKNPGKCLKIHYTHRIAPTSFGHSCSHLQGGALQRIGTLRYYRKFLNRCTDINFENRTWFKKMY